MVSPAHLRVASKPILEPKPATGEAKSKQYIGHARRVMMGIWSFLRQFTYTKFLVVTDEDINIRNWSDVIWAMTTRMDPVRDTLAVSE